MNRSTAQTPCWLHHGRSWWVLVLLLFCMGTAEAQLPNIGTLRGNRDALRGATISTPSSTNQNSAYTGDSTLVGDSMATAGLQYHKETPDSILRQRVFMFHYRPYEVKIDQLWNPTLAPTGVHISDPLDALNGNYFLGKGMLGHPHTSIVPALASGLKLQLQPDPNIGYAKRPENLWLYQAMTPYTVLSYNSSLNKDYHVRVAHTQNIKPGWNVAFDYSLLRPEGTYTSSKAKNHYLDATTNYFSRDARLQATAGIVWQSFRIDENGGLSDDTYFTRQLQSNRAGIPVRLYNMGTLHKELAAFGHATYNTVRQFESIRYRDSLVARVVDDTTTVLDTIELSDTLRVREPHTFNSGIFGVEVNYDRRKRVFADSTWWQEVSTTLFWTNDAYMDHRWRNPLKLKVGITPRIVKAAIGADTTELYSWLDPFARAELAVGRGYLRGEADMRGSLSESGIPDSRLAATFFMPLDSAGATRITLDAARQTQMPDVRMIHDAYVNQNTRLQSQTATRFDARFELHEMLDIKLTANHLSHNTWYDSTLTVHEGTSALWLYQAMLSTRLRFGWLHIDMQQILQHSTDSEQMPLPLWASKNSVYADITLFGRAVRAQIGADVRYHTLFYAPGYDPSTGIFYHQDQIEVGNYIWADVFLNINVKRASFYVKAGHLNALWESSPNYFILPHYPGQKFGLFWGLTWHFFD